MDTKEIIVLSEQNGLRLDELLSQSVSSRSLAGKIIKQSLVKKKKGNSYHIVIKPSYKVKEGECYCVTLPMEKTSEVVQLKYYEHPISIVFEDKHLLVVKKPAGIVVHPGPGHKQDTLVNILIKKIHLSSGMDPLRPGIVHRLDKDVSGLMIVSKTVEVQKLLIEQFKLKAVKRIYRALVLGIVNEPEAQIAYFIGRHPRDRKKFHCFDNEVKGSKKALTHYRVLESFKDKIHHIECRLETGRTHQIRVHLASQGMPILGDGIYFPRRRQVRALNNMEFEFKKNTLSFNQLALYSAFLQFIHPIYQKTLTFHLDWPEEFYFFMDQLHFTKSFSLQT